MRRLRVVVVAVVALGAACSGADDDSAAETTSPAASADRAGATSTPTSTASSTSTSTSTSTPDEQQFPDVVGAEATLDADGTWTFAVTISSPYDTPERYADAWRVVAPDGTVLGERVLLHDHATEQPFTRSLSGVEIRPDITTVTIEGRDQRYGYGGDTVTIDLERTTT